MRSIESRCTDRGFSRSLAESGAMWKSRFSSRLSPAPQEAEVGQVMSFAIGIVGATGVTGEVTLRVLQERSFPVGQLRLFASQRSAGQRIRWKGRDHAVEALEAGAVVIDQSSAFRLDPAVPLVVPEINESDIETHAGIIAGPNCTTAVAVMAIAPLERAVGVDSVISSSYQATSGGGRDGMAEFLDLSRKAVDQPEGLRGHEPLKLSTPRQFPQVPAFNLFPHCDVFHEGSDVSTEEEKMEPELRKILHAPALLVHATAVRVPVLVGHSVSLALSLRREIAPAEARALLSSLPGIPVLDQPWRGEYPTPLRAAGTDDILVGRVRSLPGLRNGLSLFACGDNLRKGNALNAVQVAECVLGIDRRV